VDNVIHILYFASFREQLGRAEETVPANYATISELLVELAERGEHWKSVLLDNPNVQIAVNQDIASRETPLKPGDEIAFFPPVTGG